MNDRKRDLLSDDLTNGWQFRQVGTIKWHSAEVPGCVHLDLLADKLIEDPFYRDNETKVQWIENEDWEYCLIFNVPAEIISRKHIQLIFDGLDTYATVTLNNQKIINADNMFRPWEAEVKSLLKSGQNELTVYFHSPIQQVLSQLETAHQKLPAVSDLTVGTSPYTRKSPYHYGWDWGPRLVTSGIWQPVRLEAWDNGKIIDQKFTIKSLNEKKAVIEVGVELFSDFEEQALFKIFDDDNNQLINEPIDLEIGSNLIIKELEIVDPEPWFPHGYGAQPLYTFRTEISTERAMATMSKRIGLRTLEVKREQDQWGESFTIVVNGIPIFAKGANWIPSDSFTTRVSADKYRFLLNSAVQANMNMIRVWGGGIYEADVFYDLCDELGILIWQDFMFSCALYPGDEPFLKSVQQEASYQVRRLRHHPSLALWCGNNEIEMGWRDWKWHETMPASVWEDYLEVFHVTLPKVCQREDPARLYWNSSPASDKDAILHPQASTHGDTHYWGVWHGKEPFDFYQQHFPRFISEYGFQSFPEPETVNKFTENQDHDIFSPVMLLHQKSPNGNALIKDYLEKNYLVPNDFYHFLLLTQVLQAEGIKIGAEHFRRIRSRCMGSIYWQLNDCWPVASWSSIDYFGRWKALHYYAKRFYAPILIAPHFEEGAYQFYVVSDEDEPTEATLQVKLLDFSGKLLLKFEREILIRPHKSASYYSLAKADIPESIDPGETLLYCSLEKDGKSISENAFYFELPKNQKLVPPGINVEFKKEKSGFSIILSSDRLARSVILKADQIEGQFQDNFFDLFAGQKRQIRFVTNSTINADEFKNAFSYLTLFDLMEFNLNYS